MNGDEFMIDLKLFKKMVSKNVKIITDTDADGVFSAVIMIKFLELDVKNVYFSEPHLIRNGFLKRFIGDNEALPLPDGPKIILDLPYPSIEHAKDVIFWSDHHIGNKQFLDLAKEHTEFILFDPNYGSNTELLNDSFQQLNEKTVKFITMIDSGKDMKCELDDLQTPEPLQIISSVIYHGIDERDFLLQLVDDISYKTIEELVTDEEIKQRFYIMRNRRELGREIIKQSEFYNGILIIDLTNNPLKLSIFYKDYGPIFKERLDRGEFKDSPTKELIGILRLKQDSFKEDQLNARLSGNAVCNNTVKRLIRNKKLSFREICRKFSGEGHDNVCGFKTLLKKKEFIEIFKEVWNEFIEKYLELKKEINDA